MGLYFAGAPPWLVSWASARGIRLAIESGTYLGDSAAVLAGAFGRCVTIERDPKLAADATQRFSARSDITVRLGTSRTELPLILADVDEPAFFWLDGHWSAGITAGADDPCPLMGELEAIAASPGADRHVVAVDDMRLFGFGHDLDPHMDHYPRLVEVLNAIEHLGLRTFAIDDVIVGVPPQHVDSFLALEGEIRQRVVLFPRWAEVEAAATGSGPITARVLGSLRSRLRR